jgi:hypothetical protein
MAGTCPRDATLPPVSPAALAAFRQARDGIGREVVARSLARHDEVAHHGEDAERLMAAGIGYTTRMLEAAMVVGQVALLEDQLQWAMDRLPHEGVVPAHILGRLRIYAEVVEERLPREHAAEVNRYVQWMIARMAELLDQRS